MSDVTVSTAKLDIELIARVAHEANRVIQLHFGDEVLSPKWDEAPEWQRSSAREGVEAALNGATALELHESWVESKVKDGWTYGLVKDATKRTHPCIVPYLELPEDQKLKDLMFRRIVNAFVENAQANPIRNFTNYMNVPPGQTSLDK